MPAGNGFARQFPSSGAICRKISNFFEKFKIFDRLGVSCPPANGNIYSMKETEAGYE
jgi:hypothetical protein